MIEQLRAMAVFAKVIEMGSFRAAAKALVLSPSVVSHHVGQLEASLGVALVYRTTRRLALTDDGRKLYEASRAMLAAATTGLDRIALRSESPSGLLRVTAPAAIASGRLTDDIAAFVAAFPHVELSLSFSDAPIDIFGKGVDVAIRAGTLADSALKSRKLFTFPRTLVASNAYVASRSKASSAHDLASWDWIRLASRKSEVVLLGPGGKKTKVTFTSRIHVDDAGAIHELARRGLGVAALPAAMVADDVREGRLVEVLPEWRLETANVYAIWQSKATRSGLAVRFVEFLTRR